MDKILDLKYYNVSIKDLNLIIKFEELLNFMYSELGLIRLKNEERLNDLIIQDNFNLYVSSEFLPSQIVTSIDGYKSFKNFCLNNYPDHLFGNESYLDKIPTFKNEYFEKYNKILIVYNINLMKFKKLLTKQKLNILIK